MIPTRLQKILEVKRAEVAKLLPRLDHLRKAALLRDDFRGFAAALDRGPSTLGVVAEVKKASPSAGVIAKDFDPVAIAKAYEAAGADCISVLTDEQFFQGSLAFLPRIREAVSLPCLRKDFMIHEADCILLIVAALEQGELEKLFHTAADFQMDVLVEVHTREELDRALDLGAKLIGVNNRNLHTFEVNVAATEELSEDVPEDVLLVSESGLKTRADTQRVLDCGANAILVGESLMRAGIAGIPAQMAELLSIEARSAE
jgi:indole-3-glycerol phosphate synthase